MAKFTCLMAVVLLSGLVAFPQASFSEEKPASIDSSHGVSKSCDINGTVAKLEQVTRSPYADGTPTMLALSETQVTVVVDSRSQHKNSVKGAEDTPQGEAADNCSKALQNGKPGVFTYKLCSPLSIKRGDYIHATEGIDTGSNKILGCLFDVEVVKKQNQ